MATSELPRAGEEQGGPLPRISPSVRWPTQLLFCPWRWFAALPCGALPAPGRGLSRAWLLLACSRSSLLWDSRQPVLLWVTPIPPVLGQPHWRLCIRTDGEYHQFALLTSQPLSRLEAGLRNSWCSPAPPPRVFSEPAPQRMQKDALHPRLHLLTKAPEGRAEDWDMGPWSRGRAG